MQSFITSSWCKELTEYPLHLGSLLGSLTPFFCLTLLHTQCNTHTHTHTRTYTHTHSHKLTAFQRIWRHFNTIKRAHATSYTLPATCINMHTHTHAHSPLQLWRCPSGDRVCPILFFYLGQPHTEVCTPLSPSLCPSLLLVFSLLRPNICLHSCSLSFCLLQSFSPFTLLFKSVHVYETNDRELTKFEGSFIYPVARG